MTSMRIPSPWAVARRLSERTPLQTKLVAAVLAVVLITLAAITFTSIWLTRHYLLNRVDRQLTAVAEQTAGRGWSGRDVPSPAPDPGTKEITDRVPSDMLVQVVTPTGRIVASTPAGGTDPGPTIPAGLIGLSGKHVTVQARAGGGHWRVLVTPLDSGETSLVVAMSQAGVGATVGDLTNALLVLSGVVLLLVTAMGVVIVRASMRPLRQIEGTARAIAAGDLTLRVPELNPRTEVGQVGGALNGMLNQIEAAFRARAESESAARRSAALARESEDLMRRFVADASHELRTPLTAIGGFATFYRQHGPADQAARDEIVSRIERAGERMRLLVEDLLLLARLDQERPVERGPVDLLAIVIDTVHEAQALSPEHPLAMDVRADAAYLVQGDEARLRQVLTNLVTNALTHTPSGTPIEVRIRGGVLGKMPAAVLEVADKGPGLTEAQAERVFERFYRADSARSRAVGGSGLGLSIVAALVDAHNGRVELETSPGTGAVFRVLLPLLPDDD